ISCIKSFFQSLDSYPLKGAMADILNLTLHHFNGYKDEFLPRLPSNVWHLVSQEETALSEAAVSFLLKRDPQGLNRLDQLDAHKTPLDYAFEILLKTGKSETVISLIEAGAWQMTFNRHLYQALKAKNLPAAFWQSFKKLQKHNAKLKWTVTLEEIFPLELHSSDPDRVIEGASGERRLLTEDIRRQLSNPQRHRITGEPREVWFVETQGHIAFIKFYPALVGLEQAIGELTRQVIGFGAPHGELFRFPDGQPAWISQEIPGQTLEWVFKNNPQQLNQLDPVSTAKLILMAMLVNPEDGKPANYIVEPLPDNPKLYRLASPDNDQGLVTAFVKETPKEGKLLRKREIIVQVKTVLYCLDLMNQPIPQQTRQAFLKHDPLDLMKEWIGSMQAQSKQYECLYDDPTNVWRIFQQKECFLGVPFQKDMISHLYSKWERLQDYLAQDTPELTPLELLNKLEPRLANRYRRAFAQFGVVGPFVSKFTLCDFVANDFNFEKLANPPKATIKCANCSFESYIMQDFSFQTSNGFYYSTKKCQKSAIST
ncbi:MAG: hypothetical protein K0M45_04680, partial [Candidatus Paracaedibacteraceae bacterium]|nr:hypothetical protein [Candidatus Paracaedibacteraceae bacterium]